MKNRIILLMTLLLAVSVHLNAQSVKGLIYELDKEEVRHPVTGVIVFWLGTSIAETTDTNGSFNISKKGIKKLQLVISMLGYKSDTLSLKSEDYDIEYRIFPDNYSISGVEIKGDLGGNYISKMDPRKVEILTTTELYKDACCNLSESFQTNASVDVSYSDAITGARQIQLLGLSGIYSQIQIENIPSIRGMASPFGLTYVPGSWMESIQISKGTSSVINGFESITGQINVEYKKPSNSDKLFINLYGDSETRFEGNLTTAWKLNENVSTMLMVHADDFRRKLDFNDDNFLDMPKVNFFNVFNRWEYVKPGRFHSALGIKYMKENRDGGTLDFNAKNFTDDSSAVNAGTQPYGFSLRTQRAELSWKNGIMFAGKPYKSVALILSGSWHNQEGFFGINDYQGQQNSLYANIVYKSIIGTTNHKFTAGLSYFHDNFKETYQQKLYIYDYQVSGIVNDSTLFSVNHSVENLFNLDKLEMIPGAFFEYTGVFKEKFTIIAGIRADYHNKYGFFFTPRINLRYKFNENTFLRSSCGIGYRTANVISENLSFLSSQRTLVIADNLKQEKAINYGINFTKEFKIFNRRAEFDIDIYRTEFLEQVIVDIDSTPLAVYFYNLEGKSFSNSYQVQFSFQPFKCFSLLLAYRFNDTRMTIGGKLQSNPLVNAYKGLATMTYATKFEKWKFDFTTQLNGPSRLPDQSQMPEDLRRPEKSPVYFILNAQITKKFKSIDLYIGGENLTNFRQQDPIIQSSRPYHSHFDSSVIWGPVMGIVIYGGLRFKIKG